MLDLERGFKKAMQVVIPVAVGVFIDGALDISGKIRKVLKI